MITDRTEALKAALRKNDRNATNNDAGKRITDKKNVTAVFFKEVEEISQYLEKIESNVAEVRKKLNAALTSPEADEKTKLEIESTTVEIKRLGMKVKKQLKSMEHACETERKESGTSAEFRLRITQHSTLSKRLADTMFEYNKIQNAYRERYKNRIKRELEIVGKIKTDEEIEEMLESGNPAVFTQDLLVETWEAKKTLADIEARYADIMKLEKSIKEVHELFMDIHFLVGTQGELVDHIEYNVQSAGDFVELGLQEVKKARKNKKKARRRKIILVIVLVIVIAIIGTAVALA